MRKFNNNAVEHDGSAFSLAVEIFILRNNLIGVNAESCR